MQLLPYSSLLIIAQRAFNKQFYCEFHQKMLGVTKEILRLLFDKILHSQPVKSNKKFNKSQNYSLLKADTGSSLAAFLDGMIPPIKVKAILNRIKTSPAIGGKAAFTLTPSASIAMT